MRLHLDCLMPQRTGWTLLALRNPVYRFGGILVPPGYRDHVVDSPGNLIGEDGSTPGGTKS